MRTITIHIGFPKSGSSTIQTFLDTHDEELRSRSIDYARIGRLGRKAHHNFVHELKGRKERFNPESGTIAGLADYLRDTSHNVTILSSESFAGLERGQVARFGEALSGVGKPIRIILIIRNLVDLAPSSYAQKVRYGNNTFDFDGFFDFMIERDKFNPYEVASRWGEAFGSDAVSVRVLDPKLLLNGDLLDDFLSTVGLDPDDPALRALARQARVNESTGWRALEAVRALFTNRSGLAENHPLARRAKEAVISIKRRRIGEAAETVAAEIGWNRDRGRYLTRAQAQRLHEDYVAGVRKLNEGLAVKLPEPLSLEARGFVERTEMPDVGLIPAPDLRDFYDAVERQVELNEQRLYEARIAAKAA